MLLSNGQKVKVNILTSDQTEDVLEVSAFWGWKYAGLLEMASSGGGTKLLSWSAVPSLLPAERLSDVPFLPLQAVASKLDLPEDLIGYFHLFLVRDAKDGAFSCECCDVEKAWWAALGLLLTAFFLTSYSETPGVRAALCVGHQPPQSRIQDPPA